MKTDPAPGTRVRFGTFEADLTSGELHRDGLKVKIQELPFQVLVLLLERPGEVVTREDLRSRLWPADTFVDFEQGLNRAINKVREALDDSADNPRFVETLTRRGYRFIGPVEHIAPGSYAAGSEETAGGRIRAASSQRRTLAVAAGLLLILAVVAFVGWWRAARDTSHVPNWIGDLLPGPTISFFPRVSPDGRLVAFVALVDNIAQVAVMDPSSGNWTVLTHDRNHGPTIGIPSWSQDGSTIYFARLISQPLGVYSVPALGGEERLVLANAASPESLPDGSLLVVRVDPERKLQIYHYWPVTGRQQALGAWVEVGAWVAPIRVFPEGKEAVFFGTVKGESDKVPHLYVVDTATGSSRRLAPQLRPALSGVCPLAVTSDGRAVLTSLPSGNLHRIVAIPRSGAGPVRTLMTLNSQPAVIDAAPDGSLYADQGDRPIEMLRFAASGGKPEVLASFDVSAVRYGDIFGATVELSDGRVILPSRVSGRFRLLLGKPGGSFVSLLRGNEETEGPIAQVGNDEVALMVGSPPAEELAIASIKEGRILRRFEATKGRQIESVEASPDGKSLFYVFSGSVWSISSQGGSPRRICAGDSVTVDPNGRDLIVKLNEQEHVILKRVPLSGGPEQPIQVRSSLLVAPYQVPGNNLNKDGKLLVTVAPNNSWFYGLAILDLATGKLTPVLLDYSGDVNAHGWTRDGHILATGVPMRAHIWRFRPTK
ncbi:MAG TPA: winged helix-turn-helix domain-containing protein [Terriglobia bacterium]|nr:winged helix-turn-helix domain-containing protein [Terriglobia bacterium]